MILKASGANKSSVVWRLNMKHHRSGKGNQGRNHDFFFVEHTVSIRAEPPQEVRQQRELYCPWILQNRTLWWQRWLFHLQTVCAVNDGVSGNLQRPAVVGPGFCINICICIFFFCFVFSKYGWVPGCSIIFFFFCD